MNYQELYKEDLLNVIKVIPNIESLRGKSFLITGATGLICSSVADILFVLNKILNYNIKIFLAGRNLENIHSRFNAYNNQEYEFIYYDATKEWEADFYVDYVIHGASYSDPISYSTIPVEIMLSNIIGLKCLLDYVKEIKAKRLLYVSSSEVYGKKESAEPYKETDYCYLDILNPRACYPSSKRAAESLCVSYLEEYSVDAVIVRPGHIYGPQITKNDSRAAAQFIRKAFASENIIMKSAGTQVRSYCYSLDCASAILTVLLNGNKGEAYNISNKHSIASIRELAEELATVSGTHVVFDVPSDIERKGYNMMDNSSLNASKLEALGWRGLYSLADGCKHTLSLM